ncbi:MAG: hypothetical protein H0T89_19270 [Deltaproteobacteria bacterium]|nr:hypothetical protein [Deltaproteobacteria bacterium]
MDVIARSSSFKRGTRIALVLFAAWSLGGCALAISGPAPDRPRLELPKCDTGTGPVVVDGLWATLFGVVALAAFSGDEAEVGLAALGLGVAFVASATKGHSAASACQAELVAYSGEVADQSRLLASEEQQGRQRARPATGRRGPADGKPAPAVTSVPEPTAPPAATQPDTNDAALAPLGTLTAPAKPIPTPSQAAIRTLNPRKPAPASAKPPVDDDVWSDFWKVVP